MMKMMMKMATVALTDASLASNKNNIEMSSPWDGSDQTIKEEEFCRFVVTIKHA